MSGRFVCVVPANATPVLAGAQRHEPYVVIAQVVYIELHSHAHIVLDQGEEVLGVVERKLRCAHDVVQVALQTGFGRG